MGRNGRRYVQQNYRWDVILAKYEQMFTQAAAGATAGRSSAESLEMSRCVKIDRCP